MPDPGPDSRRSSSSDPLAWVGPLIVVAVLLGALIRAWPTRIEPWFDRLGAQLRGELTGPLLGSLDATDLVALSVALIVVSTVVITALARKRGRDE